LFTEKSEITVTHRTSEELRDSLRSKLEKLQKTAVDADYEEVSE
jgi:hypothetical protein